MEFNEKLISKLHGDWQYYIRLAQQYEQRKNRNQPIDEHVIRGYQMHNIASSMIPT